MELHLTLIILCELIINSKLGTAGPRHFELQITPQKEIHTKNIAVSTHIPTWDLQNCQFFSDRSVIRTDMKYWC